MRWRSFALAVLVPAASLGGAIAPAMAGQAPTNESRYVRYEDFLVGQIGYKLAVAGAEHCSRRIPLSGFMIHQMAEYEPKDRPEITQSYRLDKGPGVLAVFPGGPASRGGLMAGDILLAINGRPVEAPAAVAARRDSRRDRSPIEEAEAAIERAGMEGAIELEYLRAGKTAKAVLNPVLGCAGRVRLARSSQPNAFADGTYAILTTKILGFAKSEDEVAMVVAHEMSHNILRHPRRLDEQRVPRGILRQFGKNASRIWATEEEADRFSIKLLAAAGYDLEAVLPFWRRFYANYDFLPQLFRTHPSLSAREKIFSEALAELENTPPTAH